jgi:hypothetical protein
VRVRREKFAGRSLAPAVAARGDGAIGTAQTLLSFRQVRVRFEVSTPDYARDGDVAAPAAATVLLVDREALYRWFVAESLRGCGIDVVPCGSLDEATRLLPGLAPPDLLIVDGEMLEGNAGTLGAVRAGLGAAPCLVLDSGADLSTSGLDSMTIAVKPVDTAAVVSLVTRQLHRA